MCLNYENCVQVVIPKFNVRRGYTKCGGPDLNRRTPTGMDPESIAFNLARQPPLCPVPVMVCCFKYFLIGIKGKDSPSVTT